MIRKVVGEMVGDRNDPNKFFVVVVIKSFVPKSVGNNINGRERGTVKF